MFRSVLFVCTGNLCRSPMAAGLLQDWCGDESIVTSGGTGALVDEPAAGHAVAVMADRGIDIGTHRARAVTPALLLANDLVLAAEAGHVRELLRMAPAIRGRVFRLGHWRDVDIPDPVGRSRADFEQCLALIEACVRDWVPRLRVATAE